MEIDRRLATRKPALERANAGARPFAELGHARQPRGGLPRRAVSAGRSSG